MGVLGTFLGRRGRDKYLAAKAKGATAETRVRTALGRASRPWWIDGVRKATQAEDQSGVDVVVSTPLGALYLQVKSSAAGAAAWLGAHARDTRPIAIVVVGPGDDLNTIYGRALGALILLRERQEIGATTTDRRS